MVKHETWIREAKDDLYRDFVYISLEGVINGDIGS